MVALPGLRLSLRLSRDLPYAGSTEPFDEMPPSALEHSGRQLIED
jgi:hypothetical protein